MSPEQVRGQDATAASDLWSLGATLYTAVEGRPPFEGASTGAVFIAIATEDPAPPTHAGPLDPILRTLLHRDPSQRPTAEHLHAQLTWLAHNRPPAPPPTVLQPPAQPTVPQPPHRPARSRKKKIILIALVAAATALTLVAAAGWAVEVFQERQGNQRYEANMSTIAGMGTIPGSSTKLTRTYKNTVEVESVLCEDTSADGCNLQGQVTPVINWFRSRTGVRSVILEPPTEEPNTYPSRSLVVLTQSSPRITEVLIYDHEHDNKIVLHFTVG
jgi:serine/threonine protein kinase